MFLITPPGYMRVLIYFNITLKAENQLRIQARFPPLEGRAGWGFSFPLLVGEGKGGVSL